MKLCGKSVEWGVSVGGGGGGGGGGHVVVAVLCRLVPSRALLCRLVPCCALLCPVVFVLCTFWIPTPLSLFLFSLFITPPHMYVFRGKSSAKEPWWPCIIMDPIRISGNAMKTWQKKQEAPGSKFAPKDFYIVMWYDPRYSNTFTCLDARYICRPQCFFFFTPHWLPPEESCSFVTCPLMFVCPFLFSFFFLCLRCSIFFCLSFLLVVIFSNIFH